MPGKRRKKRSILRRASFWQAGSRLRRRCQILFLCLAGIGLSVFVGGSIMYGRQNAWSSLLNGMGTSALRGQSLGKSAGSGKNGSLDERALSSFRKFGRVELGHFSIVRYDPASETRLLAEFDLDGVTKLRDTQTFQDLMERHRNMMRQQVEVAVLAAEPSDLEDLDLLGRKVAARINRALDQRFLESIEVKDLAFFESIGDYPYQKRE